MAGDEELRFTIIGDDELSEPLTRAGESAGNLSRHMDAAARSAKILDDALARQRTASRVSVDATLALARADRILEEAEHGLTAGALEAEFALKKQAEAAKKSGDAARKAAADNAGLAASLQKVADNAKKSGPSPLIGLGLLGTPAIATLGGVGIGAAIGIAGAFTAAAGALAAFGAVAKPVLADALTAQAAVNTAQNNYTVAIANGVNPARAYRAEQVAIGKAYAELSPQQIALSVQLGNMAQAWQNLKAAQTPVVAGALQPWLKSVTDLTSKLAPIIRTVSPVIRELGVSFDALINSPQFTKFRDFIAGTGSAAAGAAGGTLIDLVDAFIVLLPKFNPLIEKAVGWIGGLGPAVLGWSASQKTADRITAFMAWFSKNGPAVGGLLANIGAALARLAPGLTAGGAAELKIVSDFFGWVARLPKGIAAPLAETAGALLLLNKLGVFSVGVKFIGPAVKWLSGGLVNIGGGAAAGAEAGATIRAAMVSGGAAAAAEIRAAMAGGGVVAGTEGALAAQGVLKSGLSGILATAAAAAGPVAAGALIGAMLRALGDKLSPSGTFAGSLNRMFQNLSGPISSSVLHAFTFGGLEGWLTAKFGLAVGGALNNVLAGAKIWGQGIESAFRGIWDTVWNNTSGRLQRGIHDMDVSLNSWRHSQAVTFDGIRHDIAAVWDLIWNNTIGRIQRGFHDVAGLFDGGRHAIAAVWDQIRAGSALAWNQIWADTVAKVTAGITRTVGFFRALPGRILSTLGTLGSGLAGLGRSAMGQMLAGFQSAAGGILSWLGGFAKSVLGAIGSVFHIHFSEPSESGMFFKIGVQVMQGLIHGIESKVSAAQSAMSAAAGGTAGAGVQRWKSVVLQALAMEHLPASLLNDVLYQMQTESGGNPAAINLSDVNARMGTPSKGLMQVIQPTFATWHWPGTSWNIFDPLANIAAALNYASHNRGFGSGPGQIGSGHGYAYGTSSALPGWALVGERGPEMVRFRGGEQVIPSGGGGDGGLLAEVRALRAELRELTGVAAAIPARTGQHVGAAIDGAAHSASLGRRYR